MISRVIGHLFIRTLFNAAITTVLITDAISDEFCGPVAVTVVCGNRARVRQAVHTVGKVHDGFLFHVLRTAEIRRDGIGGD